MAFLGGLFGATNKAAQRAEAQKQLLELIKPLNRGLGASQQQRAAVEAAAVKLEKLNPTPKPLASPLLNGSWTLLYTTSDGILGIRLPALLRPSGPIYQILDTAELKAQNAETWPLFNQVTADLTPLSVNKVKVQFKTFKLLGLLPFTAPASAAGELSVTYLDEELRISRGDKGNLFVLAMNDPKARPAS